MAAAAAPPKVNYESDYDESADEDYNPDEPTLKRNAASDSDSDGDVDLKPDSGDEAVVGGARKKNKKSKRRKKDANGVQTLVGDTGSGGLVKTRSQKHSEKNGPKTKQPPAQKPTADIDAIFAQMTSSNTNGSSTHNVPPLADAADKTGDEGAATTTPGTQPPKPQVAKASTETLSKDVVPAGYIKIKRVYEFAGQKMEEEKVVEASSADAKLWLEEQAKQKAKSQPQPGPDGRKPLRRPMKRKSAFGDDSVPSSKPQAGQKLNTVQKSKLDWAAHVDHEGHADELETHSKAKEGYLSRMDFLNRMEAKRDQPGSKHT